MSNQMDLMLTLNEDCLDQIFKILPLSDRINLFLTYRPFYDVFSKRLRIDYKSGLNTNFFNTLKTWQLKVLLVLIGAHTRKLVVEFPFEERSYLREFIYFKFIFQFFINVESLNYYGWIVSDECVKSMKSLKNLKSLTLAGNFDVTGKYISELRGLEQLSLNNCTRIETHYFQQIFENLKNLLLLDIRNCRHLTTQNFQQISDNLQQLKTLKVSTTKENLNCLAKLPNIKHLEICRNNILSPAIAKAFLTNLAQNQAEQLEELKLIDCADFDADKAALVAKLNKLKVLHCICNAFDDEILEQLSKLKEIEELFISNSYFVSNESVLQLLENCPKLTRLNMRSCGYLTSDVIKKILQILQLQRELYTHHLKHIAVKSALKIVEINLEDTLDFVKLSYKHIHPDYDYEYITKTIKIIK